MGKLPSSPPADRNNYKAVGLLRKRTFVTLDCSVACLTAFPVPVSDPLLLDSLLSFSITPLEGLRNSGVASHVFSFIYCQGTIHLINGKWDPMGENLDKFFCWCCLSQNQTSVSAVNGRFSLNRCLFSASYCF